MKNDSLPLQGAPPVSLPAKCCARCAHGRAKIDSIMLRTMVECFAFPPTPVPVSVPGKGIAIQSMRPVMSPESDCDCFDPKGAEKPS